MKKISILVLSLVVSPTFAASTLSALTTYQDNFQAAPGPGDKPTADEVKPPVSNPVRSSSSAKCESNEQTSMPLKYLTSLIQERNAGLKIVHDPRSESVKITSKDMIGNCSSMLSWQMEKPELGGSKAYSIEAKFKTDNCKENKCTYKVAIVKDGTFQKFEEKSFEPSLKGFEECLKETGVIADGKVVPGAIYNSPINEKFTGLNYSGKITFKSNGVEALQLKPKYGEFEHIDVCNYYEKISPEVSQLLTYQDAERQRLDQEAEKLKACKIDEYSKVADFVEKYEEYADQLGQVRDQLILESAKKSAKAIKEGKATDEDLKVIADYDKYIIAPKVSRAKRLYNEMQNLKGEAQAAKKKELELALAELATYKKDPYFTKEHVNLLVNKAKFDDAESLNNLLLTVTHFSNLGKLNSKKQIQTPEVVAAAILEGHKDFVKVLESEKERYAYRTGAETGKAEYHAKIAKELQKNIQIRTANYTAVNEEEAQRIQPNGYCFVYYRANKQGCYEETVAVIQENQNKLAFYNNVDNERIQEHLKKAEEYAKLEAEGRRYIAKENGEVVEEKDPKATKAPAEDTLTPAQRSAQNDQQPQGFVPQGGYFNAQNYQQQAQMTPQNMMYPMNGMQSYSQQYSYNGNGMGNMYNQNMMYNNPYMYGQQNNFMGGQNFMGANYNLGFSGGIGNQMMMPQSMYYNNGGMMQSQMFGNPMMMGNSMGYYRP